MNVVVYEIKWYEYHLYDNKLWMILYSYIIIIVTVPLNEHCNIVNIVIEKGNSVADIYM